MDESTLYDMDDAELEAAFKEAKASAAVPDDAEDTDFETPSEDEGEVDGSEYPDDDNVDQDSDHDGDDAPTLEEEEAEEADEENSEVEDAEEASEPTDTTDDETDSADKVEEETQPVELIKVRADGKDYEFTDKEIFEQFPKVFGQAMNYTKKMQAIKPWSRAIDAIEEAKLTQDDINLMIGALKGDKGAIGEVLSRTGVDAFDLNPEEDPYVAKDYGRDETTLAIKEVVDEISQDPEYSVTQSILAEQWDEASWNTMSSDPQMIKALHVDVKNGMYDKLQPIASKLKVYDGARKSDLEYYAEASTNYYQQQELQELQTLAQQQAKTKQAEVEAVKAETRARSEIKAQSNKRKAAAPTKANAGNRTSVIDYLNASDAEFEEWRRSLDD